MISDTIKNAGKYAPLNRRFKKAFDYLQKEDLDALEPGRHDIEGDELFILKQCYETRPASEKKLEAHKNYIDIQYMIKGSEIMGYSAREDLPVHTAYNAGGDILFFKESRSTPLLVEEGCFAVFFPGEAHQPGCLDPESPERSVEKIVVKIKSDK